MIKLIIKNMSCGHCQIKIKAELEANNYRILKIDMIENSVLIDTTLSEIKKLTKILDNIHYVLDDHFPILNIEETTIWHDKLDEEATFDLFSRYLENKKISIVGFNDTDFGLIILCTAPQYLEAVQYLNEM